jgi:hypothetical protein
MGRAKLTPVRALALSTLAVVVLAAAACGGSSSAATNSNTSSSRSSQSQAHRTICNSANRVRTQVQHLVKTPLKPANAGVLLSDFQAIQSELQTMVRQAKSLSGSDRRAAMNAADRFRNSLQSMASSFAQTSSFNSAVPKIRAALRKLEGMTHTAFDPLRC